MRMFKFIRNDGTEVHIDLDSIQSLAPYVLDDGRDATVIRFGANHREDVVGPVDQIRELTGRSFMPDQHPEPETLAAAQRAYNQINNDAIDKAKAEQPEANMAAPKTYTADEIEDARAEGAFQEVRRIRDLLASPGRDIEWARGYLHARFDELHNS